ncbi:MAG TPA: DNA-3-methyladenine glycosylase 2 family protein [Methylomirabilota bacterium]|nr:DNA-3-methyladenine glycosylase 2 family protein [Methylomirabilota bacterium]
MVEFTIEPRGQFSLASAQRFLGGFTPASGTFADDATRLTMAFPVDGWAGSAAAVVWQDGELIRGEAVVSSPDVSMEAVRGQVARTLSLDHDGMGWDEVGRRDPVIGRLQAEFDHLRPVCFYSPYEAAVQAIIGQRISMRQAARIKLGLAESGGATLEIGGQKLHAFALPNRLLEVTEAPGLNPEKLNRLHEVARAALDGRLDAARLRSLPFDDALAASARSAGSASGRRSTCCCEAPAWPMPSRSQIRGLASRSRPRTTSRPSRTMRSSRRSRTAGDRSGCGASS